MRIGEGSALDMKVAISLSFVYVITTSYFPLCFGSYKEKKCNYYHGEDVLRELNPPKHFARFFDPDCEKRKLIFLSNKQGCLGALRWLEEFVGPNKTFGKSNTPFFKRIACSHKLCKDLPLFRKCGSNQHNKANPRWFRNGCRQCAASCKEVVAGRRRYARLENDECPKFYKGHTTLLEKTPPYPTIRPTTRKDSSREKDKYNVTTKFKVKETTTVATTTVESTLESTSTAQTTAAGSTPKLTTEGVTTMLATTELMTTMAECDDVKIPIRKVPTTVHCVSTTVKCKVNCSAIKEFEDDFKLPRLPSWQPKEINDG